ncbi:MAG: 4-aminobutyrate--2-oxoglutarate transaminase [Firmicutes bacterium]|nr:4-aminobutyrate--2-oxoglutarate transaminase [Bacillota bacterium]
MTSTLEPKIITEIPGPKSRELLNRFERNVPKGVFMTTPIFARRGEGALIEDVDGNVFIDFAGGIGVLNVGYSNPEVVAAVKEQAEKFFHTSINVVLYEQYLQLVEELNNIIPGNFDKETMLVNTGAEAVENAIKIVRKYTGRSDIITFTGAFHGRTLLTMSLTSKVKPYKFGFGPFAPGVHRIPYPYCYRCPYGLEYGKCNLHCANRIHDFFMENVAPEDVAAIIIEPIQGEGGFVVAPDEYITALREICDKYGILLIADEVQSGFCRTGKMFACEYWDVYPDIVTTAKSMGAGLPLGAVTARTEIIESSQVGGIGGTYCGNPIAAAGALKVIEILKRDDFAAKANNIGEICKKRFDEMKEKYNIIGDVRGRGAMVAIELVSDRENKTPAKEETGEIIKNCWRNGLVVLNAGVRGNVIRLLMPLVITNDQLKQGLDILENAVSSISKQQ